MIISLGSSRPQLPRRAPACLTPPRLPPLLRAALGCALMLACLVAPSANASPVGSQSLAEAAGQSSRGQGFPLPALLSNGECKYNLTDITSGGQHQVVLEQLQHQQQHGHQDNNPQYSDHHNQQQQHQSFGNDEDNPASQPKQVVEGDSRASVDRGCHQCEYLLPAPGPRLLILVNFTRIHSQPVAASGYSHNSSSSSSSSSTNVTAVDTSTNSSDTNPAGGQVSRTGYSSAGGDRPLTGDATSGGQLPIGTGPGGEVIGRGADNNSRGGDMLAGGEVRPTRLHHSEGEKRADHQQQPPRFHQHHINSSSSTVKTPATRRTELQHLKPTTRGGFSTAPPLPVQRGAGDDGNLTTQPGEPGAATPSPAPPVSAHELSGAATLSPAPPASAHKQSGAATAIVQSARRTGGGSRVDDTTSSRRRELFLRPQQARTPRRRLSSRPVSNSSDSPAYFFHSFPTHLLSPARVSWPSTLYPGAEEEEEGGGAEEDVGDGFGSGSDRVVTSGSASQDSGNYPPISSREDSAAGRNKPLHSDYNNNSSNDNINYNNINTYSREKKNQRHKTDSSSPPPVLSSPVQGLTASPSFPALKPVGGLDGSSGAASTPFFRTTTDRTSFNAKNSVGVGASSTSSSSRDGGLGLHVSDPQSSDYTDYHSLSESRDCSLKLIIEETASLGDISQGTDQRSLRSRRPEPQVICWQPGWERRAPLVYRYSAPVKITYLWADNTPSGFFLQFSFLSVDEVECHFQCRTARHLCLVRQQLCDGYSDCPDSSDEISGLCDSGLDQASSEKSSKAAGNLVTSVILLCGLLLVVLILILLMIKHNRSGHAARTSGDSLLASPPSHGSETCRSSQDSGQSEALLPDRPPPYSQLQQHQHLLTYTGSGVVSSLQPPQQPHHYNNNAASLHHQQQPYLLQQQQQQQPPPAAHSHNSCMVGVGGVHQSSPSSSPLLSTPITPPGGAAVSGYQHHIYSYSYPNSNNFDDDVDDFRHRAYSQQHPHQQQHLQQQQQQQPHQSPYTAHHHQQLFPQQQQHQNQKRQQQQQAKKSPPHPPPTSSSSSSLSSHPKMSSGAASCPPHISVSLDGEEGYDAAQRALHSKRQLEQNLEAEYGLFRAPPNRSALERDSPPPPYSAQPPGVTGFSLDSLLAGTLYSSSCPTSFSNSSAVVQQAPPGQGGQTGGVRLSSSTGGRALCSPESCTAASAPNSRH